jgi:hypothetical protein
MRTKLEQAAAEVAEVTDAPAPRIAAAARITAAADDDAAEAGEDVAAPRATVPGPRTGQEAEGPQLGVVTQQSFVRRFTRYNRIRDFLIDHRIRTHLISGIEFQMGVFIVGPLVGSIMGVTIGAGIGLLLFELAIVYKLMLSTRDFERAMASYRRTIDAANRDKPAVHATVEG